MENKRATMTLADSLIAELTQEAATTRRVLERVPEEKLSWAPHPKSMSLGQLSLHIAGLPRGIVELLSELTAEVPTVALPEATSVDEILSALDEGLAVATAKLTEWGDEGLTAEWTMTRGADTVLAMPRVAMVRTIMLNQIYHHRGQLTVYLRLLDVPVPPVYGPTADEDPFGRSNSGMRRSGG
ncbi:MAG: DinB family protein [Longimicrobiaceae bacterium]